MQLVIYESTKRLFRLQCNLDYPTLQETGEKNVGWPVLSEEAATDFPTFLENYEI